MTELENKDDALAARCATWQAKALAVIERKLEDAEAHAVKALTDALKQTPDGRQTVRKARRSPSFQAAHARLDELWAALAGPSVSSLDGVIRDAREDLYRAAFALWKPLIPTPLLVQADPKPTQANATAARRIVLHGYELRQELSGPILAAQRKLLAALAQAGQRSTPNRIASDLVKTWRLQSQSAIAGAVSRVLSDSEVRLNVLAGRDLIHPDHLDPEP